MTFTLEEWKESTKSHTPNTERSVRTGMVKMVSQGMPEMLALQQQTNMTQNTQNLLC